MADVGIRRIYEAPDTGDGCRVLVDRLWPRGVSKDSAAIDHWLREAAPSDALRKWFNHEPEKWPLFVTRYHEELDGRAATVAALRALVRSGRVTLVYAAKDEKHNNAAALALYLKSKARR